MSNERLNPTFLWDGIPTALIMLKSEKNIKKDIIDACNQINFFYNYTYKKTMSISELKKMIDEAFDEAEQKEELLTRDHQANILFDITAIPMHKKEEVVYKALEQLNNTTIYTIDIIIKDGEELVQVLRVYAQNERNGE